jgi:hypothetical protein
MNFRKGYRWQRLKYQLPRHPLNELVPLKTYAANNYLTISGARYRIESGKVIAYKVQGRWYVWLYPP